MGLLLQKKENNKRCPAMSQSVSLAFESMTEALKMGLSFRQFILKSKNTNKASIKE